MQRSMSEQFKGERQNQAQSNQNDLVFGYDKNGDFKPIRRNSSPRKVSSQSSGFWGYLVAGIAGFATALIATSVLSEKSPDAQEEDIKIRKDVQNKSTNPTLDAKLEGCNDIVCPITLELMKDPVVSKKCGHSFEETAITSWLDSRNYCPKCHVRLQRSDLVRNYSLKNTIQYMRDQEESKEQE